MSRADVALALLAVTSLAAILPLGVHATHGKRDLEVRTRAPYEVRADSASKAPRPEIVAGGDRVHVETSLPSGASGLDLVSYQATYGDAWKREVIEPALVGPFVAKDGDVCGYAIRIGAALFDTTRAGAGLEDLVLTQVAKQFPATFPAPMGIKVHFPALDRARSAFTITLAEGRADARLQLVFVDKTVLAVRFPARLASENGAPVVRRIGKPQVEFRGPVKDDVVRQASDLGSEGGAGLGLLGCVFGPLGCAVGVGGGALVGSAVGGEAAEIAIPIAVSMTAADTIDGQLGNLGLGRFEDPWTLSKDRPNDRVRLKLASDPTIVPSAITLPICASVHVSSPMIDAAIAGPVLTGAKLATPANGTQGKPIIDLAMNADAVNQVTWYLWQSGMLRDLGRSDLALSSLEKAVRAAAFDFTGLDPRLPPTLDARATDDDALSFVMGNVKVGHVDGARDVMSHGRLALSISGREDTVRLSALVRDLHVDCTENVDHAIHRTACFSDLVPIAREQASKRPFVQDFAGADLLAKMPTLAFGGVTLRLSDLDATTSGKFASLDLRVHGRIEARSP